MSGAPLLRVNLSAAYGQKPVLKEVRFELWQGEVLGLVGASGSGKSTLALSLLGLLPWRGGLVSGDVLLNDQNLLALPESKLRALRGSRIALIPQSPMSALNPAISLQNHFVAAWQAHEKSGSAAFMPRVQALLSEVQLPSDTEFLRRRPSQVSVGQAQRVLIALALLHNPAVIIADEPTSALDPVTQIQVLNLLKQTNRKHGTSLLYVSHDLISVLQLSDRVAVLHNGTIVETLPVSEIGNARHDASRSLLKTLPVPPEVLLNFRDLVTEDPQGGEST